MNNKKVIVKVCQYYGAYALTCKVLDNTTFGQKLAKRLDAKLEQLERDGKIRDERRARRASLRTKGRY